MNLNPLHWIEWLINEHGSSTVLRERLAQSKDENARLKLERDTFKAERDVLQSRLEKAQIEIDHLKQVNAELLEESKPTPGRPGRGF